MDRRKEHGLAAEALSRDAIDRLTDDAVHTLTALNAELTPDAIREYVEVNVRINVFSGRYFAPSASDMEEALGQSRIEDRAAHVGGDEPNARAPAFR